MLHYTASHRAWFGLARGQRLAGDRSEPQRGDRIYRAASCAKGDWIWIIFTGRRKNRSCDRRRTLTNGHSEDVGRSRGSKRADVSGAACVRVCTGRRGAQWAGWIKRVFLVGLEQKRIGSAIVNRRSGVTAGGTRARGCVDWIVGAACLKVRDVEARGAAGAVAAAVTEDAIGEGVGCGREN